jgi:putative ABC transport system ATP-binding protein
MNSPGTDAPMLEMCDIRKRYGSGPTEVTVLKGISLAIRSGELVSIMGPSGCGKSTLMNIIGCLDRPSEGIFRLEGRQIDDMDDNTLSGIRNRNIGFVFQSFYLLPRLTALDNVGLPLVYRGVGAGEIRRRSMQTLERVGMAERSHHRPSELSGGQQQRVAIARALVGMPALILADEPTGALDTVVGKEIMDLFLQLNRQEGITVVIITHDPGIAAQCGRRIRIQDGRLVECD